MALYEKIYRHLLGQIQTGALKCSERVPSEMELAEQFQVSRITTKKALELLANEGYIERKQGKGSYVTDKHPDTGPVNPAAAIPHTADYRQRRQAIGLIMPDLSESFGLRLFRAVEKHCNQTGCNLWIRLTNDEQEKEEEAIRNFTEAGAGGLIVLPVHGEYYSKELLRHVLNGIPLVIVDRYLKGIAACFVFTDNKAAAGELTRHLLHKGHRHIGILSTRPDNTTTLEERIEGCKQAMLLEGIPYNAEYLIANLQSTLPLFFKKENVEADRAVLREFVQRHPEVKAFLACEYNLALILQWELERMKLKDMDRYEIVCFDSPILPKEQKLFTHIRQNEEQIGAKAVELLDAMQAGKTVPKKHMVAYELVMKS